LGKHSEKSKMAIGRFSVVKKREIKKNRFVRKGVGTMHERGRGNNATLKEHGQDGEPLQENGSKEFTKKKLIAPLGGEGNWERKA